VSKALMIGLADGRFVEIIGDFGALTFQFFDTLGQPIGSPVAIDRNHDFTQSPVSDTLDLDHFVAVPLSGGGFEVAYYDFRGDTEGFAHIELRAAAVTSGGQVLHNIDIGIDSIGFGEKISGAQPAVPDLFPLAGDRFALVTETFAFDAPSPKIDSHVIIGGPSGLISDVVVADRPVGVSEAPGDITLTFADGTQEVLSPSGLALAARGAAHVFSASVSHPDDFSGFDAGHDQLFLTNPDGSTAGGAASTLTFDARTHGLTWDPDSDGPAPSQFLGLVNAPDLEVSNLAGGFRPAVLRSIGADGAQTITWFDADGSHDWDTLVAHEDAAGNLLTYGWTLDTGVGKLFTFDVANTQPWQRVVDDLDPSGHVTERSVLYDDGQSWTAKFQLVNEVVVRYELDSFDAAGNQVGKAFFNPDGTPV
jgi:hypothetical protein